MDALTESIRQFAARDWARVKAVAEQAQIFGDARSSAAQRLAIGAEIAQEIRRRGGIDSAARLKEELALHARFRAAFDGARFLV